MTFDLIQIIARVRRAMPRNADVMALCDALEEYFSSDATAKPKFDKKAWMREYMREWRRKEKAWREKAGD